jgi:hypothetical protein
MTLNKMTFDKTELSLINIITQSKMKFCANVRTLMTANITTLCIMTLCIMTLNLMTLPNDIRDNETQ